MDKSIIRYSFLFVNKKIRWDEIECIKIKDTFRNDFPLGFGIRYSKTLGWAYVFGSDTGLYIKLKNNKRIVLNIQSKERLISFLSDNDIKIIVQ